MKHSDALHRVCRRCGAKTGKKRVRLTAGIVKLYRTHWGVSPNDDPPGFFPNVLCGVCYKHLTAFGKGRPPTTTRPPFNFSAHAIASGGLAECNCHCCKEASSFKSRFADLRRKFRHQRDGRPTVIRTPSPSIVPICKKCCVQVADGSFHRCRQRGKRPLPEFVKAAAKRCATPTKKPILTVDAVRRIERAGDGLTCAQARSVKRDLKNLVQLPSARAMKREEYERIGSFFSVQKTNLHYGKKRSGSNRPAIVVQCTDPIAFLLSWQGDAARGRLRLKLMGDMGQGFMKFGIQLIDSRSPTLPSTSTASSSKSANSASEQQILIVTSAPESIENARQLLNSPSMKKLFLTHDVQIVADLKFQFLISGVMMGRYQCIYCHWRPELGVKRSNDRTYESNCEMFAHLQEKYAGNAQKHAIRCSGVEAQPYLDHHYDMLWAMPPPPLHLKMGIADHCYKALVRIMSPEELKAHQAALSAFGIRKSSYHGGAFEGHATCLLLKHLSELHLNPNAECQPIYDVLHAFSVVVDSCFGFKRDDDYKYHITAFAAAWVGWGVPVTPKAHYVISHVADYLERYEAPGVGLALVSEQAIEASHHHFGGLFKKYPSYGTEPSEVTTAEDDRKLMRFGNGLRDCVIKYNAQRFRWDVVRTATVHLHKWTKRVTPSNVHTCTYFS